MPFYFKYTLKIKYIIAFKTKIVIILCTKNVGYLGTLSQLLRIVFCYSHIITKLTIGTTQIRQTN